MLAAVGIDQVFELCLEAKPQHKCEKRGNQIKARCMFPGHADANPSMGIVFVDDSHVYAKCFSCGQYESDGFKIVSHITGITATSRLYAEVFGQRFGQKLSPEHDVALVQEDQQSHLKSCLLDASIHLLMSASAQLGGEYTYAQDAVNFLNRRGFPSTSFMGMGIGVFPTLAHFSVHADTEALHTIPEYLGTRVFDAKPQARGTYGGWLVFPYYTTPNTIGRLKLRDPNDKANEIWLGIHREEPRGFFGLNRAAWLVGQDLAEAREAIVVEGEFDQLAMAEGQMNMNPNAQHIVLGASGGGASDLDMLADSRIERVTLVGDNDAAGKKFVKHILSTATQERIYDFSVYDWSSLPSYNDPDEVVQGGDYPALIHGLTTRVDTKELHAWSLSEALIELGTLNAPSTVKKIDLMNAHCAYIKNEVERALYVTKVSEQTGLDAAVLSKHIVGIETERGFVINIERMLNRLAVPVAMEDAERALVFCRKTQEIFKVHLAKPRTIELAFQMRVFGMTTYDYLAGNIGIPDIIQHTQGKIKVERTLAQQAKDISGDFDRGVQNFVAPARALSKLTVRHQGFHWAIAELDPEDAKMLPPTAAPDRSYILNGHLRLVGEPNRKGLLVYRQLEEPVHGNHLLYGDDTPWSRMLTSAEFANEKPPLTRRECYNWLLKFADAWVFEHHGLVRHFIAAYLLYATHVDAFEHIPLLFLTATTQSGKSTFLKGVLRGDGYGDIRLIEHCIGFDDYTAAAVMQSAVGSTITMGLDELENPDDQNRNEAKARHVAAIFASVRNATGRKGMKRARGGRDGSPTDSNLRFPIVGAAIHPIQEEADRNRWFTLELVNEKGREKPEDYINKLLPPPLMAALRKSILLHSIQNAYLDYKSEMEIMADISLNKTIRAPDTRGLNALGPALTIMKAVGFDYVSWGQAFLDERDKALEAANTSAEKILLQAILETNAVLIPNEGARRSVLSILADPDLRPHLSRADVGVYHLPGSTYIVLHPPKLTEILRYHTFYRNTSNTSQIHGHLRRHPDVMSGAAFFTSRPKLMMHLRSFIPNPKPDDLLALSFTKLAFDRDPIGDPSDPEDVL